MQYPDFLIQHVKEKSTPYQLEGFLSGQGPKNPKFMLVGEAPGETEIHNGIPFSGRAGKHLMEFLNHLHITREEVYIRVQFEVDLINGKKKKKKAGK